MTMQVHRRIHPPLRPWALWLAVCVALFMALAPTVSHAVAWLGDTHSIEICTSDGPRTVTSNVGADSAQPSQEQDSAPSSAPSLTHCPFCLHNADRIAPPPPPVAYLFLALGGPQDFSVWQAFFFPEPRYPSAAARAPPLR